MISSLSKEFLRYMFLETGKLSGFVMLSKETVDARFASELWGILDELQDAKIIKNLRKYGQSTEQQCDFSFLPIANDYACDTITDANNSSGTITNFWGDISNSNIATGDSIDQTVTNNPSGKENWFEKYGVATIIAAVIAAAGTIIAVLLSNG